MGFNVGLTLDLSNQANLEDIEQPQFNSNQPKTTTYFHPDWNAIRKPIPLLQRHSIGVLVDEILTANELDQYTGILFIGKSGSGKSTLTGTLAHRLHMKFPYTVKWYKKKDIQNFVNIVKKLPKTPHIIIFQDASYALSGLGDDQIEEIAAQLTFIRHNTQSRIIVMIQIHYSKAIEKFFRDTDITICTSITDNERTNIKGLFGEHNAGKVDKFIRQYHDQKFKKWFTVSTNTWNKTGYIYKTNDPFRISLVSSIGTCHSLLYPKESCAQCAEESQKGKYATMQPREALQYIVSACGGDLNNLNSEATRRALNIARATGRQYIFVNKGRKVLPNNIGAAWNVYAELDHDVNLDWDEFYTLLRETSTFPRKTGYHFKRKEIAQIKEIKKNHLPTYEILTQKEQEEQPEIAEKTDEDVLNEETDGVKEI